MKSTIPLLFALDISSYLLEEPMLKRASAQHTCGRSYSTNTSKNYNFSRITMITRAIDVLSVTTIRR